MANTSTEIRTITAESFQKYGVVLDFSPEFSGAFEIILKEPDSPWRMAVYRPNDRKCTVLENHPTSLESFEPVRGTALLLVAPNDAPDNFEIFLLDKPICLFKGVWHNALALSDDVIIRINENLEVTTEFHRFEKSVHICGVSI